MQYCIVTINLTQKKSLSISRYHPLHAEIASLSVYIFILCGRFLFFEFIV